MVYAYDDYFETFQYVHIDKSRTSTSPALQPTQNSYSKNSVHRFKDVRWKTKKNVRKEETTKLYEINANSHHNWQLGAHT